MNNSAWYQKIWRKKLDELPVQEDAATSWAGMQQLLDQHMPVTGNLQPARPPKSFGATVVSLLGYIIPAAAMVGGATYAVMHVAKIKTTVTHQLKQKTYYNRHHINGTADSLTTDDSLSTQNLLLNNADSAAIKTAPEHKAPLSSAPLSHRVALVVKNADSNVQHKRNNIKLSSNASKLTQIIGTQNRAQRDGQSGNTVRPPHQSSPSVSEHMLTLQTVQPFTQQPDRASQSVVTNGVQGITPGKSTENKSDSIAENKGTGITGSSSSVPLSGTNTTNKPPAIKPGEKLKTADKSTSKKNKAAPVKQPKNKGGKRSFTLLDHYGLEAGINTDKGNAFYFGVFGSRALSDKWQLNAGVRLSIGSPVSGEYKHPSFYRPDSLAAFQVADSRRVTAIDIPVNVEYHISNKIFIKAGPVLSVNTRQYQVNGNIISHDVMDTLNYSQTIKDATNKTSINKVGLGFNGGIGLRFKQFDIEGRYQLLPAYKVSNYVGGYSKANHSFQIGIAYRFK